MTTENVKQNSKPKITTYRLCTCALMTAVMCILAPISIPIGPIPISLSTLVVFLSVFLLGTKWSAISCLIYLVLGAVGLPVFSGYTGGIGKLLGPTGGYIIGFVFTAIIAGMFLSYADKHFTGKKGVFFAFFGMLVALIATYAFGTIWFTIWSGTTFGYALTVCVLPFIPVDIIKLVIATILGRAVRSRLMKSFLQ